MLTDQEILDSVPTNSSFDERTKWLWFGRFIERAVLDKLSKQEHPEIYYVIDPRGPNENGDYYLTGADIQNLINLKNNKLFYQKDLHLIRRGITLTTWTARTVRRNQPEAGMMTGG